MIYEIILNDIKIAMKEKDTDKKDVLKQVQIKVQADSKENKKEITDEMVLSAITKELKQLNQTKDAISSKPDAPLYQSTTRKIDILNAYLPEQMSVDEIKAEIKKIMMNNPDVTGGKLTGLIMKTLKGKADNKIIKECIDEVEQIGQVVYNFPIKK